MSGVWWIALMAAAALGVGVPWVGMRMVVPSLRDSSKARATNFRGRPVYYGLGIVWLIWAGCAIIGGVVFVSLVENTVLPVLTLAGPLALVAFALGIVDDAYGSGDARGFKGHIKAMLKGRLTTGGMKLVGIGLASLVVAMIVEQVAPWGSVNSDAGPLFAVRAALVLLAGASVALTSNLFNLFDLRPGRALKVYGLLVPFAVLSVAVGLGTGSGAAWLGNARSTGAVALDATVLLLFLVGPLVAVWRYDLREEGMLGDAGANPMGATIGLLIVSGLPLWGLVLWTLLVLALNLASERVSFSAVIDGNAMLSRLDAMGRLRLAEEDVPGSNAAGKREAVPLSKDSEKSSRVSETKAQ